MRNHLERLIQLQEELVAFGVDDTSIDIGYHYTSKFRLKSIAKEGFLSSRERGLEGEERFGLGIYTGNNPLAFRRYDDTGKLIEKLPDDIDVML